MHNVTGRRAMLRARPIALAVAAILPAGAAFAQTAPNTVPTNGVYTAGTGTIQPVTPDNHLRVDQASKKGIIEWGTFSIGSAASVHFQHAFDRQGLTLNRVITPNSPSEIFGRLTSNGQLFLVNNAGVLFAPTASVSAGALVASTLNITDQNFLNGIYVFEKSGNAGSVVNQGSIVTERGYTALIGPLVRNDGVIIANAGKVALGAGDRVTLDIVGDGLISISVDQAAFNASVINTGTIQADGGTVLLKASSANALLDTVINTSGVIRANSLVERNGEIVLDGGNAGVVAASGTLQAAGGTISVRGDKVAILDGARIDVSGDAGGGTVLTNASALYVGANASVSADTLQSGDGGRVILWSNDSTQIHGTVSARGAGDGAGGFVETSGGYLEITRAPDVGAGGTWLIDPYNIFVVAAAALVNNTGAPSFTPNGNDSQIGADLISGRLNVGANVILDTGGPGSPGTQAGDITINAAINKTVVNPSFLTLNAANDVTVNAEISTNGGGFNVNARGLTNSGTISNGGGTAPGANMIFNADAFNLAGGTIDAGNAAVILRPRTGTNSFGIESAGQTTLTNADIAKINTNNFIVFGSGTGTTFTGNMTIGQNAQVQGDGKHLAFFRGTAPGTTMIGAQGVATTGDVIVSAGGGAIVSNGGGTVRGDEVQLRASQGIGTSVARVNTAANVLAINNSGPGGSFVSEVDNVTLRTFTLNVGGNLNTFGTATGGALDLQVGGALNVSAGAGVDAIVSSGGGQTITAQSVNLTAQDGRRATIENQISGHQSITATAGNMILQVPGGSGVAQIVNNATSAPSPLGPVAANQTISVSGQLNVLGGSAAPSTNSGIFKNGAGGLQTVNASGITLQGASSGTNAGALIVSRGNQLVDVTGGNINLIGGDGGTTNNASISMLQLTPTSPVGQQTILAHDINLSNGSEGAATFGTDTVAGIFGSKQVITATGDVTLTTRGANVDVAAGGPGVRIGAPGGTTTGTDLNLTVGRNLSLQGGTANENGAAIGSSGVLPPPPSNQPVPNNIFIDAGGSVTLNAGTEPNTGVRIGSGSTGTGGGNITILADGGIQLNPLNNVQQRSAAIRTLDSVTLQAASISEAGNGFILANSLTTNSTGGNTTLTGPNQVSSYNGTSSGDLSLMNTGPLTVTGVDAAGNASLVNALGDVTLTGQWTSSTASIFAGAAIVESGAGAIQAASLTTDSVGASLTGANQVGVLDARSMIDLTFNNAAPLEVARASASGSASLTSAGTMTISGPVIANNGISLTANGGSIVETASGSITTGAFGSLSTFSSGDTTLTSFTNQVSSFNATSGGDVSLVTNGFLTVTGINAAGDVAITDFGTTTVAGAWTAGGTSAITAGDILLSGTLTSADVVLNAGFGSITGFGASAIIANNLSTVSGASTTLFGENRVVNYSAAAGADLAFFNRGALNVSSLNANSANLSNNGSVTISGPWVTAGQTNITAFGLGATLSETGSGFIQATGLNGLSGEGGINLNGANRIAGTLSVSSMLGDIRLANSGDLSLGGFSPVGDVGLVNTGALNLTSLSGRNMTLTNSGPMTVSGSVVANGLMNVTVDGALTVTAVGQIPPPTPGFPPTPRFASLSASGGQNISARSLEVSAQDGAVASISNQGTGNQEITVSGGGGISVISAGGNASISNSGPFLPPPPPGGGTPPPAPPGSQTITVTDGPGIDLIADGGSATITQNAQGGAQSITTTNADHIALDGRAPLALAGITNFQGAQTISITGSGNNALRLGSSDGQGLSQVLGRSQVITAGNAANGEAGRIELFGANAPASFVGITTSNAPGAGNSQTVSTAGTITIQGGTSLSQNPLPPPLIGITSSFTGITHNSNGQQTINAGSLGLQGGAGINNGVGIASNQDGRQQVTAGAITLRGGASGQNNGATINSNSGGDQTVTVTGGSITITGGDGGSNNRAGIGSSGNQTISGNPDITLVGGAGGGELGSNNVFITANGPTKTQTINARNITVAAGAGGVNNSAGISAPKQVINTTGNLIMTGAASTGQFSGTRIGGLGGNTLSATDLTMSIGGDLLMTGGTAEFNGASIGSTLSTPALPNLISINVAGDVVMTSGTAAGTRIGTSALSDTLAGGTISIAAGGKIELNGNSAAAPTVIRTLGNVTLSAGAVITEGNFGRIEANTLNTTSGGATSLVGPNQVAVFNATSTGGDVSLNNTGVLDVTGMSAFGDATISNIGNVTVSGPWTAGGTSTITVGSDILLRSAMHSHDVVLVSTTGDILQDAGASVVAETLSTNSFGDTHLDGTNAVGTISVTSTEGDVSFNTSSPLLTLSSISLPGALLVNHTGAVSVQGEVSALSHDIHATGDVTVGGANAQSATLLYATDHIFISTSQSILVRGSDVAPLGAAAVLAEGALHFSAGSVSIVGGGALLTPAVVRGASVDMSVGNLNVTGGRGHLSPALLSSGSNIDLTVGTAVRITEGKGLLSVARIQTEIKDGVIHISFPNLEEGGYFVNGIEGRTHHGQTGFFTLNKPAKVGKTLLLEYGD